MPFAHRRAENARSISRQDFYFAGMILYVVVLDPGDAGNYTFFQGFSLNALAAFAPIRQICELPAHIDELFRGRDETARWRMHGQTGYSILLLETEFFEQLQEHPGFVCVVSTSATHAVVSKHVAGKKDKRWLHVTTVEEPTKEQKLWDLTRSDIYEWIKNSMLEIAPNEGQKLHDSEIRLLSEWTSIPTAVASRGHNVLTPTETVFLSLGYRFDLPDDRLVGNDDESFAQALATTAQALEKSLTELTGDNDRPAGSPVMILTVPSVFRHLASHRPEKETPSMVRKAIRAVTRQKQYIAFRASPEEAEEFLSSDLARSVIQMRAAELYLYTAAVTVAGCSLCCPTLRLPPQLDRVRDLLVGLATLVEKAMRRSFAGTSSHGVSDRPIGRHFLKPCSRPLILLLIEGLSSSETYRWSCFRLPDCLSHYAAVCHGCRRCRETFSCGVRLCAYLFT